MRKFILGLTVLFLSGSPISALAKDICVQNSFGQFLKFDKIKLLTGRTTVFGGRFHGNGDTLNQPFYAAVTVDSDNVTTRIIVTAMPAGDAASVPVAWYMVGDKSFNATGRYDNSPFNANGDGADSWTNSDCATFPPAFPSRAPTERTVVGPAPGIPE